MNNLPTTEPYRGAAMNGNIPDWSNVFSVVIVGRLWTDNQGQTYNKCTLFIDGVNVGYTEFTYGYLDYYIESGLDHLVRVWGMPPFKQHEVRHAYTHRTGISIGATRSNVKTKREL